MPSTPHPLYCGCLTAALLPGTADCKHRHTALGLPVSRPSTRLRLRALQIWSSWGSVFTPAVSKAMLQVTITHVAGYPHAGLCAHAAVCVAGGAHVGSGGCVESPLAWWTAEPPLACPPSCAWSMASSMRSLSLRFSFLPFLPEMRTKDSTLASRSRTGASRVPTRESTSCRVGCCQEHGQRAVR